MSRKIFYWIAVFTFALAFTAGPNGSASAAPTCLKSGCNYVDPNPPSGPTTCWNDKYIAAGGTIYTGASGKVRNYNYYSPGCIANFSWTENMNSPKVARWLGARSSPGVLYYNDYDEGKYYWVWNVMMDGTNTVCTKGYQGNTTPAVWDYYKKADGTYYSTPGTPWVCA